MTAKSSLARRAVSHLSDDGGRVPDLPAGQVDRSEAPARQDAVGQSESPQIVGIVRIASGIAVEVDDAVLRFHNCSPNAGIAAFAPVIQAWQENEDLRPLVVSEDEAVSRDYCWTSGSPKRAKWLRAFSRFDVKAQPGSRTVWLFDITRSKTADEEIVRRLDGMERAQRCTRTANWEWDLDTGICHWSEELYRIYGQSAESFVPTPYNEACLHPDDLDRVRDTLNLCIAQGEAKTFEYRIWRPNGEERSIEVHVNLLHDLDGQPMALVGAVNDVTRDKVIQEQIEDEKGKAERASRAKSEFMANMSHELRTPLNAIIGFSEVMRREMFGGLGDERYRDYAASILESGNHLLGLINDILDLAKVEAGKYRLREEEVDLIDVIDHSLNTFTVALESKDLTLARDVEEGLPLLYADRRVVQQILLNLLSNAIKFTKTGTISVSAHCRAENGGDLVLTVRDTGCGMAAKDIARAFEPFEQIESTSSLTHEGTGIGLALTKRLLEAHDGSLSLTSELDKGTTVVARFPKGRVVQ